MNKEQLIKLKRKIIMTGLTGIMIGTIGCGKVDALGKPVREPIPVEKTEELMNSKEFWTEGIRNGEVTKLYYGKYINFIYDSETEETGIYIYNSNLGGDALLYDVEHDEMVGYAIFWGSSSNVDYCEDLAKRSTSVYLPEADAYLDDFYPKSTYSLEELKSLNNLDVSENQIEKIANVKKMIKFEQFESEYIEIELPNNGKYIDEYKVIDKELDFIPGTKCKLNCQMFMNKIFFNLSLEINNQLFDEYSMKFICFLSIETGNERHGILPECAKTNNELIFSSLFHFTVIKNMIKVFYLKIQ